jgi:hypothetical protein
MKRRFFAALFAIALIGLFTASAQDQNALFQGKIMELVKDIQAQHSQMASNQAKIDTKLADLTETIRVARIFSSRAGGGHVAPAPPKP